MLASMASALFIPWFRWEAWVFDVPVMGVVTLRPFAVLVWLALLVGMVTAVIFAKTHGRSVPQTLNLALYLVLFSFPISYVLNAAFYLPEQFRSLVRYPAELFQAKLGWSMFGGIIGAIVGAWVWKWRTKGSILRIGDAAAFAGPFGWFFARLGCFGAHDHPGRVTDFFLAVADFQVGTPPYQPRHDLGLYDAIVIALVAAVFAILARKPRPDGFYVALLPILYTPCRFLLDFLRAPVADGGDIRYAGLTPGQYAAAGLFIVGVILMRRILCSSKTADARP
jgi:phosphatidylglycerol:prolipoprotein diacylglycerol transferase